MSSVFNQNELLFSLNPFDLVHLGLIDFDTASLWYKYDLGSGRLDFSPYLKVVSFT